MKVSELMTFNLVIVMILDIEHQLMSYLELWMVDFLSSLVVYLIDDGNNKGLDIEGDIIGFWFP